MHRHLTALSLYTFTLLHQSAVKKKYCYSIFKAKGVPVLTVVPLCEDKQKSEGISACILYLDIPGMFYGKHHNVTVLPSERKRSSNNWIGD
jgi:hypothetical protein